MIWLLLASDENMTQENIFKIIEPNENKRQYLKKIYKEFNKFSKIYDSVILLHLVGYLRRGNSTRLDNETFKFNQKLRDAVISFLEKYKFIERNKNNIFLKERKIDVQKIRQNADAVVLENINNLLSRFEYMEYSVYAWYDEEIKDLALELKMSLLLKALLAQYINHIYEILSNQDNYILLIEPAFEEYIKYFSQINPKIDVVIFNPELEDLLQILIPDHQGRIIVDKPMLGNLRREVHHSYDYVISFLPFSFIQEDKIASLLQGISIITSGEFVFYQYTRDAMPYGLNVLLAFFTDYNATLTDELLSSFIGRFALKYRNKSPMWNAQF